MPQYYSGFHGEYLNNLTLPDTLEHASQFLAFVTPAVLGQIVEKAKHLKTTPNEVKIKPSSYTCIIEAKTAHHLVKPLIQEHQQHANVHSDFHISGGVHEALNNILEQLSKELGAGEVSDWVGLELTGGHLTEQHKIYARMVQQTYRKIRPEVDGEWARLDEFDSPTSAVWFNGKVCLLTVVGPETRYRKIEEVTSVDNTELVSCLSTLSAEYPNLPVTVATHSFGYELFLNTIGSIPVNQVFAFNPAATAEVKNPHKTMYFVNPNDVIGKNYSLCQDVVFGAMLANRVSAASISQWV
jgi:hypothetical protein